MGLVYHLSASLRVGVEGTVLHWEASHKEGKFSYLDHGNHNILRTESGHGLILLFS